MEHLVTASDDNGLYCEVLSERIEGLRYRVDMDVMTMTAIRCNCCSIKPCKHIFLVNERFAFKASEVTCEVEVGKWYICDHEHQVWAVDGKWVCSCGDEETCSHREAVKRRLAIEPVIETPAQEVVIQEPIVETATEEAKVEPTYRIVTAPGPKRERFDYAGYVTEKREMKQDMRAEIAEIKDRKRAEDRMMAAPLTTSSGFRLMR